METKTFSLPMMDITLSWPVALVLLTCGVYVMIKVVAPFLWRCILTLLCAGLVLYGSRFHHFSARKVAMRLPKHLFLAVAKGSRHVMGITPELSFDFSTALFHNSVTTDIPWLTAFVYGVQKHAPSMRIRMVSDDPSLECKTRAQFKVSTLQWHGKHYKCLSISELEPNAEIILAFDLQRLQTVLAYYAPEVELIVVQSENPSIEYISTVRRTLIKGHFNMEKNITSMLLFPARPNVRDFEQHAKDAAK